MQYSRPETQITQSKADKHIQDKRLGGIRNNHEALFDGVVFDFVSIVSKDFGTQERSNIVNIVLFCL